MGQGTPYRHVERILRAQYRGGKVLEIGAGGAIYKGIFDDYIGLDLPDTPYADKGDIDVNGDARYLPFKPESFDLVFMVATLYLIPDPGRVCKEAWLALKRNGILLVFDYTEGTKIEAMVNNLAKGQIRNFHFWTRREFFRFFKQTGFANATQLFKDWKERLVFSAAAGIGDAHCRWLIFKGKKDI